MKRIKNYIKSIIDLISIREVRILPGHLAYFLVLTIIPLVNIFGLILPLFEGVFNDLTFSAFIPADVSNVLRPLFTGAYNGFNIISLIVAVFLASNGCNSIILISNSLYNIDDESYIKRKGKAFFMTLLLMIIVIFLFLFLAFGDVILNFIVGLNIFTNFSVQIMRIVSILKFPISFLVIYVFVSSLYMMAPNKDTFYKDIKVGSIFTSLGWLLVTGIYSYYVDNLASYALYYGGLSSIIILFIWIYMLSYIFVIGMVMNVKKFNPIRELKTSK